MSNKRDFDNLLNNSVTDGVKAAVKGLTSAANNSKPDVPVSINKPEKIKRKRRHVIHKHTSEKTNIQTPTPESEKCVQTHKKCVQTHKKRVRTHKNECPDNQPTLNRVVEKIDNLHNKKRKNLNLYENYYLYFWRNYKGTPLNKIIINLIVAFIKNGNPFIPDPHNETIINMKRYGGIKYSYSFKFHDSDNLMSKVSDIKNFTLFINYLLYVRYKELSVISDI